MLFSSVLLLLLHLATEDYLKDRPSNHNPSLPPSSSSPPSFRLVVEVKCHHLAVGAKRHGEPFKLRIVYGYKTPIESFFF